MIDTPNVVTTAEQSTAAIHVTVPRAEIQRVMGPAHQELFSTLGAQGIAPTGPWMCHHLTIDPATFDFEVSVPVARPVTPSGRVTNSRLPAARVAHTVYHGGYEGLGGAWGELDAWIKREGLDARREIWEVYATGPESGPDPASWRTELYWRLAD